MRSFHQLLLLVTFVTGTLSVTKLQDKALGELCDALIEKSRDTIPTPRFVGLMFHDCKDKCDGYIQQDRPRPVLDEITKVLNEYYTQYVQSSKHLKGISRADFWAKCALSAAEQGRKNAGSKTAPCDLPLVMRYGRRDCDGKPKEASKMQSDSKMGMMDAGTSVSGEGLLGWCDRVYKFTTRECVAIIGAGLFKDENATGSAASLAGWKLDRALFKQFKKNDSLNGTQDYEEPSRMINLFGLFKTDFNMIKNSETADLIKLYAYNNKQWLLDFGRALNKMMDRGNILQDMEITKEKAGSYHSNPLKWMRQMFVDRMSMMNMKRKFMETMHMAASN